MTIESVVLSQRNFFDTNTTKDLSFRRESLEKLLEAIEENKDTIYNALKADLGKSEQESYMTEVGLVISALKTAISRLTNGLSPSAIRHRLLISTPKAMCFTSPTV